MLILHAKQFWYWFIGPAVIAALEIIFAFFQTKLNSYGSTFIKEVNLLPSGVTHLVISRPKHFKFQAGDYISIKIPVISLTEYHPFTISSAPENEGIVFSFVRIFYKLYCFKTRFGYIFVKQVIGQINYILILIINQMSQIHYLSVLVFVVV